MYDQRNSQEQQRRRRKKTLRLFVLVLASALVVYSAVRLILYFTESEASRSTSRELQQIYEGADAGTPEQDRTENTAGPEENAAAQIPVETLPPAEQPDSGKLQSMSYPGNPGLEMSDRFRELRKKSEYIVGWLSMDGVEEAVVRRDNTFFLDHDATGKKNSNGAIFMDENIYLTTRPYTVILYGHNMKNGNMFSRLRKYKDSAYCFAHRVITFDTMYEDGKFAVFAVAEISTVPGKAAWYDIWSLESDDREEREKAIRELERISVSGSVIDVQPEEQILLLVTCLDGDTDRLIVAARRLREGETESSLTIRK